MNKVDSVPCAEVIQLSTYRRFAAISRNHGIYQVTSSQAPPLLTEKGRLSVPIACVQSLTSLRSIPFARSPGVFLLDSFLPWGDPIAIIHYINARWSTPIVMLCRDIEVGTIPLIVKKAYTAGIYDALYPPFHDEDLLETLEVLLKLQRHELAD